MQELSPAVKKETIHVAAATAVLTVLMWIVFFVLHRMMPEQVPFDYRVILGGLGGCLVAVLNFFLMGLTVQQVVNTEDEDLAGKRMKASYSRRMMMQMLWVVIAIAAPCFSRHWESRSWHFSALLNKKNGSSQFLPER